MGTFTESIEIDAPVEAVWSRLADIGEIHRWNPGVRESSQTSAGDPCNGATRHCEVGKRDYLDEEVVEWKPLEALTMRIVGTNLPFRRADIRFVLSGADGRTTVSVSPDYELKFGPAGKLLDAVIVNRTYRKGMRELLEGLRSEVEGTAIAKSSE